MGRVTPVASTQRSKEDAYGRALPRAVRYDEVDMTSPLAAVPYFDESDWAPERQVHLGRVPGGNGGPR